MAMFSIRRMVVFCPLNGEVSIALKRVTLKTHSSKCNFSFDGLKDISWDGFMLIGIRKGRCLRGGGNWEPAVCKVSQSTVDGSEIPNNHLTCMKPCVGCVGETANHSLAHKV